MLTTGIYSVPVGEIAWRGLPFSHWGVEYAWHHRASMLPPGCGIFWVNKRLFMVSQFIKRTLAIVLFRPMTCLRHANPIVPLLILNQRFLYIYISSNKMV
jgi:hypothetical protein